MKLVLVGQKIRLIRERIEISQAELASILQVPEQTVQNIEQGHQELTSEVLKALVHRMNISADWLLYDRGEMHLTCLSRSKPSPGDAGALAATPTSEEQALDERIRQLEERIKTETQLPLKQIRFLFTRILNLPVEGDAAAPQQELPAIKLQHMSFMDKTLYYNELKCQMKEGRQEFLSRFHKLVSLVCRQGS